MVESSVGCPVNRGGTAQRTSDDETKKNRRIRTGGGGGKRGLFKRRLRQADREPWLDHHKDDKR